MLSVVPGFYDFAAQTCSPPGRVFHSQRPAGSHRVPGASSRCGSWCWLGPCKTRCIGAERRSSPQGWGIRCRPPVVQRWLGSVGEFPSFISEHAELSRTPHDVPMDRGEIRVWLRVGPCAVSGRDGPGSGPSGGDGGSITSVPLPSQHQPTRTAVPTSSAEQGMDTASDPFSGERNFFLTKKNKKKIPTLSMFFKEKQRLEIL